MKEQKNSRSAGTETTANAKPRKILHTHYNTHLTKFQVLVFILFIGIMCVTISLSHTTQTSELIATEHKVRQGECLWNIAEEYKPSCISMDKYMGWIYSHNDGGLIYPGDVVVVGVYES